jgi:hypothetical protein
VQFTVTKSRNKIRIISAKMQLEDEISPDKDEKRDPQIKGAAY